MMESFVPWVVTSSLLNARKSSMATASTSMMYSLVNNTKKVYLFYYVGTKALLMVPLPLSSLSNAKLH